MEHTAYIALGSNLGDRTHYLSEAARLIGERVGDVLAVSSPMETEPVGFESEHKFLNQVLAVRTSLAPRALLTVTREIERELGRERKSVGGIHFDRTCDVDILMIDDLVYHDEWLEIPHPRMRERLFVLRPLAEIAPDVIDPVTGKTIRELLWDVS